MRPSGRTASQLRDIRLEPGFAKYAEGSCMIRVGNTHVLCTASLEDKVPSFLRNTNSGWITAEYGMLPRSTHNRVDREAARGKQTGRTQEIQRLIGRSLRAIVDLKKLGERQIKIDCDVIQADGGTRSAAITGAYVALYQALKKLVDDKIIKELPLTHQVASISCGLYQGHPVLDLDYEEDSQAEADANFILTSNGRIIEIQTTAEKNPFTEEEFQALFELARSGIDHLAKLQKRALNIG